MVEGALVLVDGAQSAAHLRIDVAELGCDFFAFSGHKVYGPTGVGVLYGRATCSTAMPPWQGGGDMIEQVALEGSTWAVPPARFEAGTPPIAEVLGLATALDYFEAVGLGSHRGLGRASSCAWPPSGSARFGECASSAPRGRRSPSSRSFSMGSTLTTWARFWTTKVWRCGRAITVRSRS